MATVYVVNKDGKPLMPTTRCGHVRFLLKTGKARVVERKPFTVQLTYNSTDETQDLILGIDPGRTNIGLSVVTTTGKDLFHAEVITRNKEIPKLMSARKAYRQQHRKLKRRDKRRRRARAANTVKADTFERLLPGCENPIICHDIKNKEARFNNRKRPDGWLTPTANQLLQTHINVVKKLQKFLPITKVTLEVNKFAFMAMDNPRVQKWQFQRGPLYGKGSVEAAVFTAQDGRCALCGSDIDHYHHIVPRHLGGSNTLPNIIGLCSHCHGEVHTDSKVKSKLATLKAGMNKKYGALSVLNQIIPQLTERLADILPTFVTDGSSTAVFRNAHGVDKRHSLDAYCIACSVLELSVTHDPKTEPLFIRQFRRHDRQACHKQNLNRKYYDGDNKLVATNRHKATEQAADSLEEYRFTRGESATCNLTVKPHLTIYKDMQRWMPGSLVSFDGQVGVLQGANGRHNGKVNYYVAVTGEKTLSKKCKFMQNNRGLVIL